VTVASAGSLTERSPAAARPPRTAMSPAGIFINAPPIDPDSYKYTPDLDRD
jgi:hypothetical protein